VLPLRHELPVSILVTCGQVFRRLTDVTGCIERTQARGRIREGARDLDRPVIGVQAVGGAG
jgi:hypothetical protein